MARLSRGWRSFSIVAFIVSGVLLKPLAGHSQRSDSTATQSKWAEKWHMSHSPLKATVYSAILPGAGQVYNRKWWKAGIAWAGLGTCAFFIHDNTKQYKYYRQQYIYQVDGDPNTVVTAPANIDLNATQENYRRWLDISYMSLAGVYILQIIDANVDAHLMYFDTGDDLGLFVRPSSIYTTGHSHGIALVWRF